MDEDGNVEHGAENQDPNCKDTDPKIMGKSVAKDGKFGNISNPVNDANNMDEDQEYIFTDPKRKRPNNSTGDNPLTDNAGLPKNVQAAGLNGGVCRDS